MTTPNPNYPIFELRVALRVSDYERSVKFYCEGLGIAPGAEETIDYQIPTFTLKGNLVHFAAFKNHIGFYPTPTGIEKFKKELSVYEGAKGSVQFPLDKPMPLGLISKIVKFRVKENLERAASKGKKRRDP